MRHLLILAAALASFAIEAAPSTTTLYVHGHIYTGNPVTPWAESLAVDGSTIAAVGTDAALARYRSRATVVDLKGKTVIPGLVDAHMHLLFGALTLDGLNLSTPERSLTAAHPDEFVAALKNFAEQHPDRRVLIARGDFSTAQPTAPDRALLDRAVPDRPVVIHNASEHAVWVNSKALELAGITDLPVTDEVAERNIFRDANGRPGGVLLEAAQDLIHNAVLKSLTTEEKLALLRRATRYLNSFGITSIVNATGNLAEIELYGMLRDRGDLTVRTRTAFGSVSVPHRLTPEFLADLEAARSRFHDDWVSANLVKFFADGSTGYVPPLVYRPADYRALVLELDRRGFQLMTHAQRGDSVHMILDAYENAIAKNGARERRLRIEHDFLIQDADIDRYARLGVIAGVQPAFCCSELGTGYDAKDPTVSDRWRTLLDRGVRLAFSSDWPCMWPPDPYFNIQQAVTRQAWRSPDTAGIDAGVRDGARNGGAKPLPGTYYGKNEAVTVRESIDAYTQGAAYAAYADRLVGTLEKGKAADLVVLSQDPFAVPSDRIGETRAVLTVVGGRVVYDAKADTAR